MQPKTEQAFKEAKNSPTHSDARGLFIAPAEAEGGAVIRIHIHPNRKPYILKKPLPRKGAGGANQSTNTLD